MASLFDPMGFLAPSFLIQAKIILQEIWTRGLEWDDEIVDSNILTKAESWLNQLNKLDDIKVPRCIWLEKDKKVLSITLHTFVDASQEAYGAVVYAKAIYVSGNQSCRLIAAKTKVAPLKAMSILRLELMATVLGTRLTTSITNTLTVKPEQVTHWSESMNVLWWIRNASRKYQVFVANHVGEIQMLTNPTQWRYIPCEENPTDLLTRGVTLSTLASMNFWWHGPSFLAHDESTWPINRIEMQTSPNEERRNYYKKKMRRKQEESVEGEEITERTMTAVNANAVQSWRLQPTLFSSWQRLVRVRGWVNRLITNCRTVDGPIHRELTSDEIRDVENAIIAKSQRESFPLELQALQCEKELPKNSKLLGLCPCLHKNGLIRSNGRLQYAEFLPFDVRFPIILPRKHYVTKLLVKYYHEQGCHIGGTNQTLADISSPFWIVSGREEVRDWEKECSEFRRRNARQQLK
ncbi:uncharacterized protein LOC114531185 [Dendronephthya gigantea]|uniref:uncharacterized protein LOC114531185 n=1 Tax=Dendronephthya gigantea TaxID=151771 RepID=UPI0010691E0F|nr:uncharacterized protein LOC114531185 [Dendronephthya gigantea]